MSDDKHERAARRLLVEAIQDGVDPVERIAAVLRGRDEPRDTDPMRRLSASELEQVPQVNDAEVDRALMDGQADRDAAVAGTPGSTEHNLVHDIGRDRIVCKRCGQLGLECAGTSCPVYDEKDEGLRLAEDALADAIVERVETLDDLHMNGVNLSETVRQLGEALECREMDRVVRLVRGLFGSIGGRDQQPLSWPPDTDPVR